MAYALLAAYMYLCVSILRLQKEETKSLYEKSCEGQFMLQEEERMHKSCASVGLKVMTIRIQEQIRDTVVVGARGDRRNSTEEK